MFGFRQNRRRLVADRGRPTEEAQEQAGASESPRRRTIRRQTEHGEGRFSDDPRNSAVLGLGAAGFGFSARQFVELEPKRERNAMERQRNTNLGIDTNFNFNLNANFNARQTSIANSMQLKTPHQRRNRVQA
jgi:hypothetical protein